MSTKQCPFCAEEIQEETVVCRHCGRDLVPEALPMVDAPKADEKARKKANQSGFLALAFLTVGSILAGVLSFASFSFILICFLGMGLGVLVLRQTTRKGLGTFFVICSLLAILGSGFLIKADYDAAQEAEQRAEQQRLEAEQQRLEAENRMEELRQAMPENYALGMKLLEEKDYKGALAAFKNVAEVDANYENLPDLVQEVNEGLEAQKVAERLERAKTLVAEAGKLSWSSNCSELETAERHLLQARQLDPNQENESLVKKIRVSRLSCYQGNHAIQMAVRIEYDSLLTLYVWIKNVSRTARQADPNNFTLVTKDGQSLSIAASTYNHSSYFEAVDLQPNAKTGGYLVFDTRSEPKTLIYKDLSGTQISREFP